MGAQRAETSPATVVAAGRRTTPTSDRWARALQEVLANPAQPRLVYQPVVDLRRGVVAGYEALARFDSSHVSAPPDAWFAAAARHDCAVELEARVVARVVQVLPTLPVPRFLCVNVSPDLLTSPVLRAAFGDGPLTGLVVELTEHVEYDVTARLLDTLAALRSAGAMVAVDDAGSGYAGLAQLLAVRPQLVKLDRSLVDGVDGDPGRTATVQLLGTLAGHLDAWVLAEGVERVEELEACLALGVPLAQGFLFGRPSEGWGDVPVELAARLRRDALRLVGGDRVRGLALPGNPVGPRQQPPPDAGYVVGVDAISCPEVLHVPLRRVGDGARGGHRACREFLRVHGDTGLADAARRAMIRPPNRRFEPLVVVDDLGRLLGLLSIDALVHALAAISERTTP